MNDKKIQLRTATLEDIPFLKYWDTQQHNIDADPNDEWNWELELNRQPIWREQLVGELDGTPIGFIQIIDPFEEDSHYWGVVEKNLRAIDIWIGEKENLGQGYGTEMMTLAINRCFKNPEVVSILIDPLATNTKAHKFYKKFGFKFVEKRSFGEDICFVYRLGRSDWLSSHTMSNESLRRKL